ncbi:hypothetical protein K239x_22290 [Planctomycetes bacterium K23_9]|uniref:Uncharacterized protein n=1 Tax=Stieleria marina TaxID=1930275 RepID=A0A517NT30_9BACT|nr:hypothetical protein K239x_22290 [Planctomycetes bacterium K23_9]
MLDGDRMAVQTVTVVVQVASTCCFRICDVACGDAAEHESRERQPIAGRAGRIVAPCYCCAVFIRIRNRVKSKFGK